MQTSLNLTAVFEKVEEGYIGYVEEISGVNTQGETLEETKHNLLEALELILEARRDLMQKEIQGKQVIKENIQLLA